MKLAPSHLTAVTTLLLSVAVSDVCAQGDTYDRLHTYFRDVARAWQIEATAGRIRQRDMTESGGPETDPSFKHYRADSDRFLVSGSFLVHDRIRLRGTLGMADMNLRSSEGETREFDAAPAVGIAVEGVLGALRDYPVTFLASASYLIFECDDSSITHVADPSHEAASWETLKVDWSEWQLELRGVVDLDYPVKLHAGLRLNGISADETGDILSSRFSATLKEDDSFGLFAALEYALREDLALTLQANFHDSSDFSINLRYAL